MRKFWAFLEKSQWNVTQDVNYGGVWSKLGDELSHSLCNPFCTILHNNFCSMSHLPQVNASKKDTEEPRTDTQKYAKVQGGAEMEWRKKLHVLKAGLSRTQ